ncbi:hypothetical protein D9M73_231300 [compost metagenome]
MTGQVAGNHREPHAQCPLHQMAIEPHVVVVAVQHYQAGACIGRQPELGDQRIAGRLDAAQARLHAGNARGEVQPVERTIALGLAQVGGACGQGSQQRTQEIGLERV